MTLIAVALLLSGCNAGKAGRVVGNVVAAANIIDQIKKPDDENCIARGGLPTLNDNGNIYCRWENDTY